MLIKRFLASLAALVAVFGVAASAQDAMAPVGTTFDAPYQDKGVGSGVNFVADQLMDYDLQVFAPADYSLLDEKPKPSTGVFFTYDRTFSGITSSESTTIFGQSAPSFNYETWGNRFEFGFMGENDKGWTAIIQTMGGSTWLYGRTGLNSNPMIIGTKVQSYELNRVFRQELKHGGYFEPYIGGRFTYMSDHTIQDTLTDVFGFGDPTISDWDRFLQESQNNGFGGNIGARFFKENGRFRWSTQTAVALHYNSQFNSASNIILDENGVVNLVVERGFNSDHFLPLWEGRLDLAYDITRDLSLRVGGQVMWYWEGLTRANTLTNGAVALNPNSIRSGNPVTNPLAVITNQDTILYGLTFGVEWRR